MKDEGGKINTSKTDPESWRQVKNIFFEVLEQPEAEKESFLSQACGNDLKIKKEVEDLLAAHFESESFIETPVFEIASIFKSSDTGAEGKRFGHYKIVREIGVGGMGAVYLATRDDGEFSQQVAIKIVRFTLADSEIINRFRRERQILASLNHPHIAKLLDGGVTDDGLPFLVMEYVAGETVAKYAEQENLPESERLRLFLKICSAVAYAHRNLIVHRDIKPSNILVTAEGEPKLLDFGLAKILDEGLADENQTQTAFRAMTPAYASPEQIRGDAVTTLSDIYSLGKVLSELLSHSRQKKNDKRKKEKFDSLPIDLRNITAKALQEEPERRYKSAEAFAEDIEKYLKGLPVSARPNSFVYRAEKFVKRNKIGVAAGLLIVLILFGGIAATIWQARAAARERDKAVAAQTRAERINAFLQDMLKSASPEENGKDAKVLDVLNDAAGRIENEFNDQPEQKIEILLTLSRTYLNLAVYDAAELHARHALDLSIRNFGETNKLTAYSQLELSIGLVIAARKTEAESLLRQSLQTQQILSLTHTKEYAETEYVIAELLLREGGIKEAEPFLQDALKLQTEFFGEDSLEATTTNLSLGRLSEISGDLNTAEIAYRKTAEFFRQSPRYRSRLILSLVNLGHLLIKKGKYEEADNALLEALEISQSILNNVAYLRGMILNYRSQIQFYKNDFVKAEQTAREALVSLESVVSKDDGEILGLKTRLGMILTKQSKFAEAEKILRQNLEIAQTVQNKDSWISVINLRLGEALLAQNRFQEAEPLILNAHEEFEKTLGDKHIYTQQAVKDAGMLYEKLNNHELAAKYRALEIPAASPEN